MHIKLEWTPRITTAVYKCPKSFNSFIDIVKTVAVAPTDYFAAVTVMLWLPPEVEDNTLLLLCLFGYTINEWLRSKLSRFSLSAMIFFIFYFLILLTRAQNL